MYSIKIDPRQLTDLWKLREYAGQGSIAGQIRKAIDDYIERQHGKIPEVERACQGMLKNRPK